MIVGWELWGWRVYVGGGVDVDDDVGRVVVVVVGK